MLEVAEARRDVQPDPGIVNLHGRAGAEAVAVGCDELDVEQPHRACVVAGQKRAGTWSEWGRLRRCWRCTSVAELPCRGARVLG